MRRRRVAFHAESDDEYLAKVKSSDMLESASKIQLSQISAYSHPDKLQEYICKYSQPPTTERFPQLSVSTSKSQDYKSIGRNSMEYDGFNYQENQAISHILASSPTDESFTPRKSSDPDDFGLSDYEAGKSPTPAQSTIKIILLGDDQFSKNAFMKYLFGEHDHGGLISSPLDLQVRTHDKGDSSVKYHIWIKNCLEENANGKHKSIYMIYYKSVSSFVFLYSINNRDSFLCLNQSIKSLLNDVGPEKFKGILIGFKGEENGAFGENNQREVSTEEAEQLKQDTGLRYSFEIDLNDGSQRENILKLLEDLKKENAKTS